MKFEACIKKCNKDWEFDTNIAQMDEDFEQLARYFCYTGHREGLWEKDEKRRKYMRKFYKPVVDCQSKKNLQVWGERVKEVAQDKQKFIETEIKKWENGSREVFKSEVEVKAWTNALAQAKQCMEQGKDHPVSISNHVINSFLLWYRLVSWRQVSKLEKKSIYLTLVWMKQV